MKIDDLWLIPFPGFYETLFEPQGDEYMLSSYLELTSEQVNDNSFMNRLYDSFDSVAYEQDVAQKCADFIESELCRVLKVDFNELFSFSNPHIWSPREYNFANDHLEVCFTTNDEERLRQVLLAWCAEHKDYLINCIKRDNMACSGYIPFYSNQYDEWMREWQRLDDDPVAFAELLAYIAMSDIDTDDFDANLYDFSMCDICEADYYTTPETVETEVGL